MIVGQIRDAIGNGNITNSVNFPESIDTLINRMVIVIRNYSIMVSQLSVDLAKYETSIKINGQSV